MWLNNRFSVSGFDFLIYCPGAKSASVKRHSIVLTSTVLALAVASLATIVAVYWWLGKPVTLSTAPVDASTKLDCVSYSPFRGRQSPWIPEFVINPDHIRQDLAELAKVSRCVRTYSVDNGLDKVPQLASEAGLTMILGVWLGRDRQKNALLIDLAVSLVKQHPGTITSLVVGNEVLLRGEMLPSDLRQLIRSAKARVSIPVTYAEVWEFWLRYPEVAADVDFVTVHILPYWEDDPVRAEEAAAYVDSVRQRLALAFAGKEILIGETGWPSRGRMRAGALPSPINQARFISEVLQRSRSQNYRVNLFEAFDEPWKRMWEGTVGAYWGLFDSRDRQPKYLPGTPVGNHPLWTLQLEIGLAFSVGTFAVALLAARRTRTRPPLTAWLAISVFATVGGTLLGLSAEEFAYESYDFGGWLIQGLLFAAGMAAPLLASDALVSKRRLPAFVNLVGSAAEGRLSPADKITGFTLMAITLIGTEIALGHTFDSRWRDFPFAGLTMSVVPFFILTLVDRQKRESPPLAESVFAGLLTMAAFYFAVHEGAHNWQSLWTAGVLLLLGATLYEIRPIDEKRSSPPTGSASKASYEPDDAARTREPAELVTSRVERSRVERAI
jgi:exo-beta-1,3-glucanase (GH17 family)